MKYILIKNPFEWCDTKKSYPIKAKHDVIYSMQIDSFLQQIISKVRPHNWRIFIKFLYPAYIKTFRNIFIKKLIVYYFSIHRIFIVKKMNQMGVMIDATVYWYPAINSWAPHFIESLFLKEFTKIKPFKDIPYEKQILHSNLL